MVPPGTSGSAAAAGCWSGGIVVVVVGGMVVVVVGTGRVTRAARGRAGVEADDGDPSRTHRPAPTASATAHRAKNTLTMTRERTIFFRAGS